MQMNQLPHIHTHALDLEPIRFQKIATGEINFVCLPNLGFYEYDVLIFNETRNGIKTGLCLHVQVDSVEKIFHRGIDTNLVSIELHLVPDSPPSLEPEPFYDDEPANSDDFSPVDDSGDRITWGGIIALSSLGVLALGLFWLVDHFHV
ncbi:MULTISPECIES: hypothetical protein [Gammaproteobacteria]|uniref:hypothetical protein n=1 Tax=Gammaproteobacteria TaxID=1236 RepID=UPI003A8D6972